MIQLALVVAAGSLVSGLVLAYLLKRAPTVGVQLAGLALIHPATRHALRGMTLGDVRVEWAVRHHPKWEPEDVQVDWPRTRHHTPWKPELADADRSRRR